MQSFIDKKTHTVTSAEAAAFEATITVNVKKQMRNTAVRIWNDTDFWERHEVYAVTMDGQRISLGDCIATDKSTGIVDFIPILDINYVRVVSSNPSAGANISVHVTGEVC